MADSALTRMFWSRVEKSGDRPAQLVKRGGRWQTLTWSEVGGVVRELALGLVAAGVQRGDAVALLSASRPERVQADMALLSAGGVTAPVYATYPPELIAHIVNDAGTRTLIVENPAQLEKVLEVKGKMPGLGRVVAGAAISTTSSMRKVGSPRRRSRGRSSGCSSRSSRGWRSRSRTGPSASEPGATKSSASPGPASRSTSLTLTSQRTRRRIGP